MRSLYGNRTTLWFGLLAHVVACVVIYVKTVDWHFIGFAGLFAVVALGRLYDMRQFDRARLGHLTSADLDRWELRYLLGASLVCATLGMLCFFSIFVLRDPFAELASLTILLASVVSIVGRNYASAKAVVLMSICTLIPVLAGLVLAGLVADGTTEVHDIFHIDRGYPRFVENLRGLGGVIVRVGSE